ncbi:hypothetical protein VW23_017710 [Devosia insulae DS-56]|uniref:ATP-binding protein n=1 Tax=Devosia insulae DS-56 TaxID=1116389 RepID=A0A1E5XRI4_9HYPH|nr:hypothetical protein VW23_017710 [Devosia insulae DS-56]
MSGAVETAARSSSPKLMPRPDASIDAVDLILAPVPEAARPVRRPRPPPPPSTNDLLAQLVRTQVPQPPRADEPPVDIAERDRAIDDVVRELLEDRDAAYRSVAVLYQDFLVRCRIRRVPGEALALPAFRRKLAVVRAGVAEETAQSETWQTALSLSTQLADDVQGVFLVLARAALEGLPCPSDAALARAYGTHSTGRARRLLAYFEERGLLVVRMDLRNQRIVAFPDLSTETAPGNPDAPDYDDRAAAE